MNCRADPLAVSPDRWDYSRRKPGKVQVIQHEVCEFYSLKLADLIGPSRKRRIAWPRQMAMALACEFTDLSLPEIGRRFGGRDHTTVIWGRDAVQERYKANRAQRDAYDEISRRLSALLRTEFIRHHVAHPVFRSVRTPKGGR